MEFRGIWVEFSHPRAYSALQQWCGHVTAKQPSLAVDAHQGLSEDLQADKSSAQCI